MSTTADKDKRISKLTHDIVSNTSTIISIAQMSLFSEGLSDELREEFERIMETAHTVVELVEQLGQVLEEE